MPVAERNGQFTVKFHVSNRKKQSVKLLGSDASSRKGEDQFTVGFSCEKC